MNWEENDSVLYNILLFSPRGPEKTNNTSVRMCDFQAVKQTQDPYNPLFSTTG
jgi:hypothetical protein